MHTILLKSQYYSTLAHTCFGPHWPIIREHTVVQLCVPWSSYHHVKSGESILIVACSFTFLSCLWKCKTCWESVYVMYISVHLFETCSFKIFSKLRLHIHVKVLVCLHADCSWLLFINNLNWNMVTSLINFDTITHCFIKIEFGVTSFNANFASVHVSWQLWANWWLTTW